MTVPGLNGVIRAVVKTAWNQYGATVIGIEDGFEGVVEGRMHEIQQKEASNILSLGGTILGSSNVGDPGHYPVEQADGSDRNPEHVAQGATQSQAVEHWMR